MRNAFKPRRPDVVQTFVSEAAKLCDPDKARGLTLGQALDPTLWDEPSTVQQLRDQNAALKSALKALHEALS